MVFATAEHPQSDAAKRLCVSYDPIPLPDDKVAKASKKKRQTSGLTMSGPIDVDANSEASPPPMPVRRAVAATASELARQGPPQRSAPQRSADSHAERPQRGLPGSSRHPTNIAMPRGANADDVPYELDPNPDPPYDTRQLYPSPIRPREPIVFSPLKVPDALLNKKRRRIARDTPATRDTREPSLQPDIATLPRGAKRKLGPEETNSRRDDSPARAENPPDRLLPAFHGGRSPSRSDVGVRRAPSDANDFYSRAPSPRRVVSGDQWLSREVSREPPDRFRPPSRARAHARDIPVVPQDPQLSMYGQSQDYVRNVSRAPSDWPRQFTRGLTRPIPREPTRYPSYEMQTRMDYLQPPHDRRYRDEVLYEDQREYENRYYNARDFADQNGDRYGPADGDMSY